MAARKPANRPVRVEDVAREAGVSPITVSRTLSNSEKVRPETRGLVMAAVERTGYVLNRNASSLRSGRSSIVAVFVSNLANPHFANAIQGCQDALEGSRYRLLMAQTGYTDSLQDGAVEDILPFRPAGLIFTSIVRSERIRALLAGLDVPVMEMWDDVPDPIDMLVGFSNHHGGLLLGRHFGECGYRRIAYAGRTRNRGEQRLAGFREGLAAFGLAPQLVLPLEGRGTVPDGIAALDSLLAQLPQCDAALFSSDILAAGAMLRARQLGIDVPAQLAIAGYGDLDFAAHLAIPLTSVHVASAELGHIAGTMMLRRLNGEAVAIQSVITPVHLAARESTGIR